MNPLQQEKPKFLKSAKWFSESLGPRRGGSKWALKSGTSLVGQKSGRDSMSCYLFVCYIRSKHHHPRECCNEARKSRDTFMYFDNVKKWRMLLSRKARGPKRKGKAWRGNCKHKSGFPPLQRRKGANTWKKGSQQKQEFCRLLSFLEETNIFTKATKKNHACWITLSVALPEIQW